MPLSLRDLLTAPTEDELVDDMLGVLAAAGFPVTSWHVGGVARTLIKLFAKGFVSLSQLVTVIAGSAFNSTASGGQLTVLSDEVYGNTRTPATTAEVLVRLEVTSPTAGPYTITAGTSWVAWGDKRYRSMVGGSLAYGTPLDVTYLAESPGSAYNAPDDAVGALVTALPGVEITASVLTEQGLDEETDEALRDRNRGKWGTVGSAGNASGYATWAREASAQVTRVRVYEATPDPGDVKVVVGGSSGAIGALTVALIESYVAARAPLCTTVDVVSVSTQAIAVTGTVRIHATSPNAALALAQVQAAIAALFAETDIGGVVYLSDIYQAIEGVEGVDTSTLTSPTGDTALAADAVPVLSGTLTSTLV